MPINPGSPNKKKNALLVLVALSAILLIYGIIKIIMKPPGSSFGGVGIQEHSKVVDEMQEKQIVDIAIDSPEPTASILWQGDFESGVWGDTKNQAVGGDSLWTQD